MFSNWMVGFPLGAGFGGWVYSKVYRSTGGNTKNALIVAAIAGVGGMVVVATLMGIFFKS
jgi:hypothetical protein